MFDSTESVSVMRSMILRPRESERVVETARGDGLDYDLDGDCEVNGLS